jgi:hypothetical protein
VNRAVAGSQLRDGRDVSGATAGYLMGDQVRNFLHINYSKTQNNNNNNNK